MGPKSGAYCARINNSYPGYIRLLLRLSQQKEGHEESFQQYAWTMNDISQKINEQDPRCPALNMNVDNLTRWFRANNGKREVRQWALQFHRQVLAVYVCFLDEKWFYTRFRRKRAKILPIGEGEVASRGRLPALRTNDRCKGDPVMAMAVVSKPYLEHDFDGNISFICVPRKKIRGSGSHVRRFSAQVKKNEDIKQSWRDALLR